MRGFIDIIEEGFWFKVVGICIWNYKVFLNENIEWCMILSSVFVEMCIRVWEYNLVVEGLFSLYTIRF